MSKARSEPFVPASENVRELTVASLVLGLFLGVVMTAANTYLGLYAGMTVSASIPAAVISMGILRGLLRRGTILENNIVQTIASAGESLAAGIIFTMPAMILTGVWSEFRYWPVTIVAMLGGFLGVLFMIPLRQALIVEEEELIYPEGLACAGVLVEGERGGSGVRTIFTALGLGFVFKFLVSGFSLIQGTVEAAWSAGRTALYMGSDMSVSLLGVGFIVGPNVAALVCLGGLLGWVVGIPLFGLLQGLPGGETVLDQVETTWSTQIRYVGVGAMIVGGLWSILSVRRGILAGIRGVVEGYRSSRTAGAAGSSVPRTSLDLPLPGILGVLLFTTGGLLILYRFLIGDSGTTLIAWAAMIFAGFFFVAVSSYIVGLVGSSNNPVSGMTICTVLFVSGLLLAFGMSGTTAILAALGVAGVVCCAACTAGDISQDLKTGYIVGATPRSQQLAQLAGVLVPAFTIAPVLTLLKHAYGIGEAAREGVEPLQAPQASLFASIMHSMFSGGSLPWTMVVIGMVLGAVLIAADEVLRRNKAPFRAYVMPVAVGVYLPLSLSVPILAGGIVAALVRRMAAPRGEAGADEAVHQGVLFSSGLVAGEAMMGVVIAILISAGLPVPIGVLDNAFVSLLAMAGIIALLMWMALRRAR